ncbi:hypothetical protein DBR47_23810 [Paucibacter sp. KBW04]|nr:nucleotidyltransferase family protein [Paucibacter sp. KBW04]RQO53507.1 hypothetical protein DBR47_23810 [Paucibacter sp. KBW04]
MEALRAVRGLGLASWCIGAGVLRNLVWDALHGKSPADSSAHVMSDVDVVFFDASDLSPEREAALQARLSQCMPTLPWEVSNQARVHLWFESCFGHAVPPLTSLHEAVASWPEYATAVAVWLDEADRLHVLAPHGLSDLFSCTVRRNPIRVSVETYHQRVSQKRYAERWPRVRVLAA